MALHISTSKLLSHDIYTPCLFRSDLLRYWRLVLGPDFPLDRLSAVLPLERSYPAVPLARQLVHQRFPILGPLVQKNDSFSLNRFEPLTPSLLRRDGVHPLFERGVRYRRTDFSPEKDRIRTVSQRTKPNSRTAFIGEQPNPWDLLQPQDAMHFPPCFHGNRLYHHLTQTRCESLAYYGRGQTLRQPPVLTFNPSRTPYPLWG
jgi:hypothetical protein